jgi:glycopeptide antibiotics resistance protein
MAANKKDNKIVMWVCFLAYLLLLGYVVFISSGLGRVEHEEYRYNLTLFQEIGRYYGIGNRTGNWTLFRFNVIGNVCVFMPLGVFLPKLFERCRRLLAVLVLSLELSLAIEIVQLVSRIGSFDVDDLLLNTIGGILGYFVYKIFVGAKSKQGKSKQDKAKKRKRQA